MNARLFTQPRHALFVLTAFALAGWLLYANTLDVPFIFDDKQNILDNPHIRLEDLSPESVQTALFNKPCKRRPVVKLTFAANYYVHQYRVRGYHIANILIHITNGFLIFLLFGKTLILLNKARKPDPGTVIPAAFFATLLWFANPLQTQSVTYIVQRMTSLSTLFYVLSLLFYIYGRCSGHHRRRKYFFGAALISGLLALGSKELSATLPVFILLYEFYFFRHADIHWDRKKLLLLGACLLGLAGIALLFLGKAPFDAIFSGYDSRPFTPGQRLLTELRVVVYYLGLLAFPHPSRLALDYDIAVSHSLFSPATTGLSLLFIIALTVFALRFAKKAPLFSFAVLWYLGNLVIESTVIPLELVYEHRLYLPSLFIFLALTYYAFRWVKQQKVQAALVVFLLGVTLTWSAWTVMRNQTWASELLLWRDNAEKFPNDARTQYNLGIAYKDAGDLEKAAQCYQKALDLNLELGPDEAHNSLGVVLFQLGKKDEAFRHFKQAIVINPTNVKALNNIGNVYKDRNDLQKAGDYYRKSLAVNPDYPEAIENLSALADHMKNLQRALNTLQQQRGATPGDPVITYKMAVIYQRLGQTDEAVRHVEHALLIKPDFAKALLKLANLSIERNDYPKAVSALTRLYETSTGKPVIPYNIACLYGRMGKVADAVHWLEKAIDAGYANWDAILNDTDLKDVRNSEAFQELSRKRER